MIVNVLIFLTGLLVYAGYGLPGFAYLAAATALSYIAGLLIPKHKWVMWVSIALNAGMLVLCKLQPVLGFELLAPVGISYFTLCIISYNADLYKGKYAPERNFFRYALYVTYLPKMSIGPIERYDTMQKALFQDRVITFDGILAGGARAVWGLAKKLIIASRVGVIVSAISAKPDEYSGAYALLAMLLYSIQLYCDFSGGIDSVIGISQMLGVKLSENFDRPYFAESFQEFWRRWHMTLGGWLRNYIYIPLGGNRKGTLRKYLNTVITFLVSGFWHGSSYLLWGLFNGIFVCFGEKLKTKWKTLNRIAMFLLVSLLWSFFVWPDTLTALQMVGSVFTVFNYGELAAQLGTMGLTLGDWIVLAVACLALWGYDIHFKQLGLWFAKQQPWVKTALIGLLALLVLIFGMYGIGFNADAFIYSRF